MTTTALQKFQNSYKKKISKKDGKHSFGLLEADDVLGYQQEYIIKLLNEAEHFLIRVMGYSKYIETQGFRFLPSYSKIFKTTDTVFENSAFIWKEVGEKTERQVEHLRSHNVPVFDLRLKKDFDYLQPFFKEEILKIRAVLDDVCHEKKPIPIVEPFYKCPCFNCRTQKIAIPDFEFNSDIYGELSREKVSSEIHINDAPEKYKHMFEEDYYRRNVQRSDILSYRQVSRDDGLKTYHLKVKFQGKPTGYFSKETHTLFIMYYIKTFSLFWEPMTKEEFGKKNKNQLRLRDSLKRCMYCDDYFLSRYSVAPKGKGRGYPRGVWVVCDNPICIKKRDSAKTLETQKRNHLR